jgi:DNA-binding response OmpR family regulator
LGGSRRFHLSPREFAILFELAIRDGHVVPREQLYRLVWRERARARKRDVDVYVKRVRDKLAEVAPGWRYLHTHPAVGTDLNAERVVESR